MRKVYSSCAASFMTFLQRPWIKIFRIFNGIHTPISPPLQTSRKGEDLHLTTVAADVSYYFLFAAPHTCPPNQNCWGLCKSEVCCQFQVLFQRMEVFDGEKVIEEFEELTRDAGRVQVETLKKILEENGWAEYLQNLGLNGRTDPESFKECVPLATHDDFEAYIQRIADGDSSPILTGKPIESMSLSSGTTKGRPNGIMTGSMEPYLMKLRHYAGHLPLMSADYGSSEGWIGPNVNPLLPPELTTFAVLPNVGYFEFIPLKANAQDQEQEGAQENKPVGLTEVKIGEEYEIVVTNVAGLYRYRLGDVVKVMGFHNATPELKFVCRSNILPSINIDKITEKDLQLAVEAARNVLAAEKLELVEFTSHVDMSSEPGHYVIFWEISGEAKEEVLIECCNRLDRAFQDAGYVSSRKVKAIGALELRVVRKGTFRKIMEHSLSLGSAMSQYKTPRAVGSTNNAILHILRSNVVNSYFSTAF
ncbi:Jasmonoyl--L-amino acid synthetase JAR4, partial [Cucurbita argyrosperma subsp. sororia]